MVALGGHLAGLLIVGANSVYPAYRACQNYVAPRIQPESSADNAVDQAPCPPASEAGRAADQTEANNALLEPTAI